MQRRKSLLKRKTKKSHFYHRRKAAITHPFKNSLSELELVHRIWRGIKDYNVHLGETVDAHAQLLRAKPGVNMCIYDQFQILSCF